MKTISLGGVWQFKARDTYHALPQSMKRATQWMRGTVPGTVHTDLMANGVIPDPYVGMNENNVQWVDEQQWLYRREFFVPASFVEETNVELVAEGLDTIARITCNGRLAGETANMFIAHRLPLKPYLHAGKNVLEILFDSPTRYARALDQKHGRLKVALEPPRVYIRKAQYSFSWDWGPKLTTSGIWRHIRLEAYSEGRLANPRVRVVTVTARRAELELSVDVLRPPSRNLAVHIFVGGENGISEHTVAVRGNSAKARVIVDNPALWWPHGHGGQPMYAAVFTLRHGGDDVHQIQVPFGIRTVRLLQEKDAEGESFIIEVNGRKIFCKGADWIPSDNFLPRITAETYETLLMRARDASMNMIRVWGGGIYEQDIFYNICDRLGLMVWQDFMFACGEYPSYPAFLDNVREESESVMLRLRNHPSIVLWCGNNECEWLFCTENPDKSPDDMHGSVIFRDLLPQAVRVHDGTRPYWRSSPFGKGFPNSESNGNHHQWIVWSFWRDYSEYVNDNARFITEFGFQAPANRKTFEEVIHPDDRHSQSRAMEHHNKQVEGQERLFRFQAAHYRVGGGFDEFLYKGQLVQAEALKTAAEHWRRRKFNTAGVMFWQLNDCWPVSSWAVIDSGLRPKAAYFYAKKFFAPLLLSFRPTAKGLEVWLTNDTMNALRCRIRLTIQSFGGRVRHRTEMPATVGPNLSRKVGLLAKSPPEGELLSCYLLGEVKAGSLTAENRLYFGEPKHLVLPKATVRLRILKGRDGLHEVALRSSTLAKNVRLELDGETGPFDDNYFDLDPGKEKRVKVESGETATTLRRRLKLTCLNHA